MIGRGAGGSSDVPFGALASFSAAVPRPRSASYQCHSAACSNAALPAAAAAAGSTDWNTLSHSDTITQLDLTFGDLTGAAVSSGTSITDGGSFDSGASKHPKAKKVSPTVTDDAFANHYKTRMWHVFLGSMAGARTAASPTARWAGARTL